LVLAVTMVAVGDRVGEQLFDD
ncbi:MAG: hypothetical protein FD131_2339, partial [Rhodocyclaceae bacterium]